MTRQNVPNSVLAKLDELDEQAEDLTRKLANTEQGIAAAHTRHRVNLRPDGNRQLRRSLWVELLLDPSVNSHRLHMRGA
jgi:hypothetical protein